jgi:predicted TIM-barrel fold metal-dependent hydrolase
MNSLPIFDSLTHPTRNGDWIDATYAGKNFIRPLLSDMDETNVQWAFAVGMKNVGEYDEDCYSDFILTESRQFRPIAFFDFDKCSNVSRVRRNLIGLKKKRYVGIKIHPRISGITLDNPLLPSVITEANNLNMAVLLCTYFYEATKYAYKNNINNLIRLLGEVPNQKLILLHGGTVQLMAMMEIARSFREVVVDLSLTLCKYAGSSLDHDIRFLFNKFDRRICIGSDSPEFTLQEMRERFEYLSEGVPREKLLNIACNNLLRFVGEETYEIS